MGAEENNPTTNTPSPEVKQLLESQKKLQEQITTLSEQNARQQQLYAAQLEKLSKGPADKQDTKPDLWSDYDDGLSTAVKQTVKESEKQLEQKFEKKLEGRLTRDKQEQQYNTMLYRDYPQVLDPAHPLQTEYLKVKAQKTQHDPDYLDSPSAVYDLTAIAYANLVRKGEIVPDDFADEVQRTLSINDGMSLGAGGSNSRTAEKAEDRV